MATTKPDLDIVGELVTEFGENPSYVAGLLSPSPAGEGTVERARSA